MTLYRSSLVVSVLAVALLIPAPAQAAPNPLTCAGYAEPRTFVEGQSWWRATAGEPGVDQGHGHFGACIPAEQQLSGVVHIDWVIKLHENPGYAKEILAEVSTDSNPEAGTTTVWAGGPDYACPEDCTFVVPTHFDTSLSPNDGREELQYRLRIKQPDGNIMRPAVRIPVRLVNGRPYDDRERSEISTYGWYTNANYAYVRLHSGLPTAAVAGRWTFNASFLSNEISNSVTHWSIAVDPSLHATPPDPGSILYDSDTLCAPFTLSCHGPQRTTFTVDTTRLADGPHKLFLRTDARDPRDSTNTGVMVVPFTVGNATPPPPPPPPTLALTSPAGGATVSGAAVKLNVGHLVGMTRVEYFVDGVRVAYDDSVPDFSELWDTTKVAGGQHSIVATATTAEGPVSTSPVVVTVANG